MARSWVSRRGFRGAKQPETTQLRSWLSSGETTTAIGVVRQFPGESSHYEISTEAGAREILVDVELVPSSVRLSCRLGFGGQGVYRIPKVGTEVAVILPIDSSSLIRDPADYGGIIVATLDNDCPPELTDDDIIVIQSNSVTILSDNIQLGTGTPNPLDEVVVGSGIDSFTGSPYKALGNTTSKVKAVK